jgi:hypothetical protein
MSKKRKGKRNEREAQDLYREAGYETFSPQESKYGETDIFNQFDILAIHPENGGPVRLVQVKSNQPGSMSGWAEDSIQYAVKGVVVELLTAYDGHGGPNPTPKRWRLIMPTAHGGGIKLLDRVDERKEEIPADGHGIIEYLKDESGI